MDLRQRRKRAEIANEFIEHIASCGRKFFRDRKTGEVSHLEVDERGQVWFIDSTSGRRIYTHYPYRWRGFSQGGTLKHLIEHLREFIMDRGGIPRLYLGPWPKGWYGWGYGDDMGSVRQKAEELGLFEGETKEVAHA